MSERNNEVGEIFVGIALLLGLHIAVLMLGGIFVGILSSIGGAFSNVTIGLLYAAFGIGLVQLLYVIPTVVILVRERRWGVMKGVIICAVITALLNGGCWLVLFASFR